MCDWNKKLVIGVSSRALFDLTSENEIFEKEGVDAYCRYQMEHEDDILKKGPGFGLIEALLKVNELPGMEDRVEVIIMSHNSPDTSLRVFNTIKHYGLNISRAVLASGASLAPYLTTFDGIRSFNGLVNGTIVPNVYGRFYNVGVQNTSYSKSENNYYYVSAKAAATVKGHDLEIGFNYDQYTAASYGLSAYQLWTLMRQSANAHISQLDFSSPIEHFVDGDLYVDYNRLNGGGQTCFDESLRRALGLDVNGSDWLDIDRYSPEDYNNYGGINMFSANELFNSGNQIVSYFGYDHTGEKYNARTWSLDDFFDPVSRGHKNFQYLPAFSPIYAAGYIQDKFFFQDLIFNVGVRVDYYDGNQMVLKDPYLLYESYTVGDLNNGMAAYGFG